MKRLATVLLLAAACGGSRAAAPTCPQPAPAPATAEPAPAAVEPAPAPAPPPIDRAQIADLAATRSYNLGLPRPIALLPDGDALFLRTGPRDYVAELFEVDAATGKTRKLASAADLVASADVALSAAEKARRERTRTAIRGIVGASVSADGAKLLIALGQQVFLLDRATGKATAVDLGAGYPDSPMLSPDGKRVAFVRDGDVWTTEIGGKPRRITKKDGPDVTNGSAEFAAQEELDRTAGMWWSPDGTRLIYQRTDESKVDTLHVSDPAHPERPPTPFRYPRAGTNNADVRLAVIGATGGKPTWIEWDRAAFPYVHDVQWPEHGPPSLVVLNRPQTELRVLTIDAKTGKTTTVITETDPAWVNTTGGPRWDKDGKTFLWLHEVETGWELNRHDATGKRLETVVPGDADFHGRYAVDEQSGEVWFARGTPVESHVWSVDAHGQGLTQRTDARGTQFVGIAPRGGATRLVIHNGIDGARTMTLVARDGKPIAELPSVAEDGPRLPSVSVVSVRGTARAYHAAIVRPRDFDPKKRYPVVLQVYGGPGVTLTSSNPRAYWKDQLLADTGFIVVRGDGRGTPGRGRAWERVISGDLITVPLADQIDLLQALGKLHPELDLARVGVVGWSFGGYFSAMAAELRPDVFKAAIAGAPVTDWRLYDTAYTERYMRMPEENAAAYDATSAVKNAAKLSVPLLIIHGFTDDNVYIANTLALTDALLQAGKDFDLVPLSSTHMVADPASEAALLTRQIDFFRAHLGLPVARTE